MNDNDKIPEYIPGMELTLKACRINKNLSVTEVAKRLNVTRQCIYSWETGRTCPNNDTIFKLQLLYGINYNNIKFCIK